MVDIDEVTEKAARETKVNNEKCIWCKHPPKNPTHLDTGEKICHSCIGDLREWKRTRYLDLIISSELKASVQSMLLDEWGELRDLVADIHSIDPKLKALPSRTSNAYECVTHNGPTRNTRD